MKTKVGILKELCEKITGEKSNGTTIVEVLQDIVDNYPVTPEETNEQEENL